MLTACRPPSLFPRRGAGTERRPGCRCPARRTDAPARSTRCPARSTSSPPVARSVKPSSATRCSRYLWAAGHGETTLARVMASVTRAPLHSHSARAVGIKDIKAVMAEAEERGAGGAVAPSCSWTRSTASTRHSRTQFLRASSQATSSSLCTTETHPSSERALLSPRGCFVLRPLSEDHLVGLLRRGSPMRAGPWAASA